MRRTGLTIGQVRDADAVTFRYDQGLIFCRWRLLEHTDLYPPADVLLLATGRCFSVETARVRAAEWLAVNRLKDPPEPPPETATESVAEMLRAKFKGELSQ